MWIGTYPPCVGCGYCCWKVVCTFGADLYGPEAPCKGLVWSEAKQRHYCQLVIDEGADSAQASMMAIGEGCTSPANTWYREPNQDRMK